MEILLYRFREAPLEIRLRGGKTRNVRSAKIFPKEINDNPSVNLKILINVSNTQTFIKVRVKLGADGI